MPRSWSRSSTRSGDIAQRSTRSALAIAASLALAACGGGSSESSTDDSPGATAPSSEPESSAPAATEPPATEAPATDPPATDPPATDPPATDPPATDPATTDAPPTTDFVLGADTVGEDFGGGFLTMDVWPGWEVTDGSIEPVTIFDDIESEPWTYDPDASELLVELSSGEAVMAVLRERRFVAVESYGQFRTGMIDAFGEIASYQIDAPTTWAGLDGYTTSFPFGTVRTAQVDDQFVSVLTFGIDTDELSEQVGAMIDNLRFDPSVIGPLAHATELEFFTTAGGPEFAASILVPASWQQVDGGDSLEFADPLTGSNASITITPSQGGVDAMVDVIASTNLLAADPVRVDGEVNGLAHAVLWDGEPSEADTAIIVADDGAYGVAILVETATMLVGDEPAGGRLIAQIVDSVFYGPHS
jgi:hypothetical protein